MNLPPKAKPIKSFNIVSWTGENEGEKIILYAPSGMGKSTLASMLPNPVFIGVDDGARKIRHPKTGEPVKAITGVTTFADVRKVLADVTLFNDFETIVIDTVTELQHLGLAYTFKTVPKDKGGAAINIEDYGWHKGYRYWYDTMRLILQACDNLIHNSKNICFIAQANTIRLANPAGEDFLQDGPELYHDKNVSILNQYVSWSDHVLKIGYSHVAVKEEKAGSSGRRAIFVHPEIHFIAKSRSIPQKYAVVSFDEPGDDSIWRILFGDK